MPIITKQRSTPYLENTALERRWAALKARGVNLPWLWTAGYSSATIKGSNISNTSNNPHTAGAAKTAHIDSDEQRYIKLTMNGAIGDRGIITLSQSSTFVQSFRPGMQMAFKTKIQFSTFTGIRLSLGLSGSTSFSEMMYDDHTTAANAAKANVLAGHYSDNLGDTNMYGVANNTNSGAQLRTDSGIAVSTLGTATPFWIFMDYTAETEATLAFYDNDGAQVGSDLVLSGARMPIVSRAMAPFFGIENSGAVAAEMRYWRTNALFNVAQ